MPAKHGAEHGAVLHLVVHDEDVDEPFRGSFRLRERHGRLRLENHT